MKPDSLRRRLLSVGATLLAGSALLAATPAHAADDALNAVQQRGTLRIGIEGTYPPFNYQDEKGQFVGFEIDLGNALAETLGVKAQFQPTKWDGLLAALDSGRIDVIINQVTITDARQKKYRFSQHYTVSGIQAVTCTKDVDTLQFPNALAGKKVSMSLTCFDYRTSCCTELATALDLEAVAAAGVRIGADPLGGASVQYWEYLAEHSRLDLTVVNPKMDPTIMLVNMGLLYNQQHF